MAKGPKYFWWDGADLEPFFEEVERRGAKNVRIEFHHKEGFLYVRDRNAVQALSHNGETGHNFVKTCPPTCPGD